MVEGRRERERGGNMEEEIQTYRFTVLDFPSVVRDISHLIDTRNQNQCYGILSPSPSFSPPLSLSLSPSPSHQVKMT